MTDLRRRQLWTRARMVLGVFVSLFSLCLGLLAVPAAGSNATGVRISLPLLQPGGIRDYRLFAPTTMPIAGSIPLVLMLHSLGHSNSEIEQQSGMDELAQQHGFAVAYPVGLGQAWNAGRCCSTDPSGKVVQTDDVGFLADVISSVATLIPIDKKRVFVAGFSNGAMMALRFACEQPALVAGVISVAGTLETDCSANAGIRLLQVHGERDDTVPYNGSRYSNLVHAPLNSVSDTIRTFARIDGCSGSTAVSSDVMTISSFSKCARGSVSLVSIKNVGHIWPNPANSRFDGSAAIWDFMQG